MTEGEWASPEGTVCRIIFIERHKFYIQRQSRQINTLQRYMNCAPHLPLDRRAFPWSHFRHLSHFDSTI